MLKSKSNTYGLFKACTRVTSAEALKAGVKAHPTWDDCECPWLGRNGKVRYVNLAEWAGLPLPISKTRAKEVLAEVKVAIKSRTFRKEGKHHDPSKLGAGMSFAAFIQRYRTYLTDERDPIIPDTTDNFLHCMLRLWEEELGSYPLTDIVQSPTILEDWLKKRAKGGKRVTKAGRTISWKKWTNNVAWNRYRDHAHAMFKWGCHKKRGLCLSNPCDDIDSKTEAKRDPLRIGNEGVSEADLFAALEKAWPPCAEHPKLDAIRRNIRLAMERRLYLAFANAARKTEMLKVQVKHVSWNTREVSLPVSKKKTKTGEQEKLGIMDDTLWALMEKRRFLGPEAFIFGWENGREQKGFRKAWHRLFTFAGLPVGRGKGFVWHSIRGEAISTFGENPEVSAQAQQDFARHENAATTEHYRQSAKLNLRELMKKARRA